MFVLALTLALAQAAAPAAVVLRCEVRDDLRGRVYELHRSGNGADAVWTLVMRSREGGADAPVRLPLPGAAPEIEGDRVTLDYQTQNGGRDIEWRVSPVRSTLDVHANFELEVNIEPDLDPRVEEMNTGGVLSNLSCASPPAG
jgi:hypothetical protein